MGATTPIIPAYVTFQSVKHLKLMYGDEYDNYFLQQENKMSEQSIENKLVEKGLNAPRLNPDMIDSVIVHETFTPLPSGKCLICELTLSNGFTVRGESACVSPENFNMEIGKEISRKDARNKIWVFEGYLLQQRVHDASLSEDPCEETHS